MGRIRVGIVGGGPGGLVTAYLLQKRIPTSCEVTLYEASPRLGGKVLTRRFDSAPVAYEAGAAELYDYSATGPDPLRELVAELGLGTSPMAGDVVVMGDHVLRTWNDIGRAFGDPAVRAIKAFTRRARASVSLADYYESDAKEDNDSPLVRHSFRALLNTIPDRHARDYVRVAVHSDVATEPHRTTAMYGLHNYLMNEPGYMSLYSINGGNERLVTELARRVTARVHLDHPVTRVERAAGGRYRVTARHRGTLVWEDFDYVVVALPNNWLPAVEWGGAELDRAMDRHHAHYDHPAHYLRVSVLFDTPFWRRAVADSYFMLDAFGGCCVYDESSRADAGGLGVLGWLLAGDAAMTMSNLDDDALTAAVLDSLPPALGDARRHFRESKVHRWVGSVNGCPGGRPVLPQEARHRPEPVGHPGLFVVGDYLYDSTLNGVLDSVEFVADKLEDEVKARSSPTPVFAARNGSIPGTPAAASP